MWQLEKLQALVASTKAMLKSQPEGSLASSHLKLAQERLDDAIRALKYNRFDQALNSCRQSMIQAGLAQALARYGAAIDAGLRQLEESSERRRSEAEQMVSYLASSLVQMKCAIEYANLEVGTRAREILDNAMDFYNDSMTALKAGEELLATRAAQAGLLALALAGRILKMDNELVFLPGWRDLSNPMLASPLRGADESVDLLVACREELANAGEETAARARPHYEKAVNNYHSCIVSLAEDGIAHAQAMLGAANSEIEKARFILAQEFEDLPQRKKSRKGKWVPIVNVEAMLHDIEALAGTDLSVNRALRKLPVIKQLYKESTRAFGKGELDEAERAAAEALLEVDILRSILFGSEEEE